MASITRYKGGWRAHIRRAGHPSASKTFATKQEAQRWARDHETKLDQGRRVPSRLRTTFGELLTLYRDEINPGAGRSKRLTLAAILTELGSARLAELTPAAFMDYAKKRERAGAGPATILMDFSYISTVLRHAGHLARADEAAQMALAGLHTARTTLRHSGRLAQAQMRTRRPTTRELALLQRHWLEHPPRFIPMWELTCFAIATTMRVSEIVRLRREDYDPHTRTILVRERKHPTKKATNHQRVPLLKGYAWVLFYQLDSAAMVEDRIKVSSGSVLYPYDAHSVSSMFTRAVRRCGIEDLNFHDLRHDGVSRMFEHGFTIEQVSICSGHQSWTQLRRYTNIRPETLHR